jgi:hypothetical protein
LLTYDADLGGGGDLPDPSSEAATAAQPAQLQYQVMLEVRRRPTFFSSDQLSI